MRLVDPNDEGGSASFVTQGGKWPQPGGLGSPITLTYSFQNMFDGGLQDAQRPAAAQQPDSQFDRRGTGRVGQRRAAQLRRSAGRRITLRQLRRQYGQIRFRHIYLNGPDPPPPALPDRQGPGVFSQLGRTLAGDVEYDHGDPWQEVGTLPMPDILGATIHELGHSLGLGHTDLPEANMYWIFTRYSGLGTGKLHADDIAGIRSIYGSGSGSVVSLVPEPATWSLAIALSLQPRRDSPNR